MVSFCFGVIAGIGSGEGDVRLIPGDFVAAGVPGIDKTRVRAGEPEADIDTEEVTRERGFDFVGVVVDAEWVDISLLVLGNFVLVFTD